MPHRGPGPGPGFRTRGPRLGLRHAPPYPTSLQCGCELPNSGLRTQAPVAPGVGGSLIPEILKNRAGRSGLRVPAHRPRPHPRSRPQSASDFPAPWGPRAPDSNPNPATPAGSLKIKKIKIKSPCASVSHLGNGPEDPAAWIGKGQWARRPRGVDGDRPSVAAPPA